MKVVALILLLCSSVFVNAEKLMLSTEEYAPLSYTKNGTIKGVATEQVELIFKRANIDYDMEVFPWARSYNNALSKKHHCVFTTSNTPERENFFKWVEPISLNMSVLVKLKGNNLAVKSLEEAKLYTIGIQNQDVAGDYLKKQGFTRLDVANDVDISLKKLKAKRFDMIAMAESRYITMSSEGEPIEKVIDIFSIKMGLACNKSVTDETITKLQVELNKLISDGTQQKIKERY
jgi:polar amino acid transport system substrate-binding protein